MGKHKNVVLLLISLILLGYAGLLSIYPNVLNSTFELDKFEQKLSEATSLTTSIGSIDFKVKPNLNMIITVRELAAKYIDDQECFSAGTVQLTTNPFAVLTNDYKLKDVYLRNVIYANQILPSGENKLAFLPSTIKTDILSKKDIKITPSEIKMKNYKQKEITPTSYNESSYREKTISKEEVYDFLSGLNIYKFDIKK